MMPQQQQQQEPLRHANRRQSHLTLRMLCSGANMASWLASAFYKASSSTSVLFQFYKQQGSYLSNCNDRKSTHWQMSRPPLGLMEPSLTKTG